MNPVGFILVALSLCGIAIAITMRMTSHLCRAHLANHRHTSYRTLLLAGFSAPLLLILTETFVEPATREGAITLGNAFVLLSCIAVMCVLTALAVVMYYEEAMKAR